MSLSNKSLSRLESIISAIDSGAVQQDEMVRAIDAVIAIIDQNGKTLVDKIVATKTASDSDIANLKADLRQVKTNLQGVISDVKLSSEANVDRVRASLLTEIKRVESLIPELPPETDLSEVFNEIESQKEQLKDLSFLIIGENVRNSLEALNGEDRLDISAIKGVDELVEKMKSVSGAQKSFGVRLLKYLADVNVEGITDGQTLVWDETTGKFIAGAGGGGLPDQTGNSGKFLTTDGTDASWATLTGGGDMAAAVYDPQEIGGDAFDTDNHTDGTTNKVFTATEKTKLAGIEALADVTDTTNVTAAGALMDSEVTNLAAVKAFNPADYATAAQGTLAGTAVQPGDNVSDLTNDAGYVTTSGYVPGGTDVALADGGTGASLTDPNADRIMFWDDSAGAVTWLTASTGLTISTTSMTVRTSSSTQTGIVELATDAETVTGTDTARATTPANITAKMAAPGAIGGTTPAAITGTTITANTHVNLPAQTASTVAILDASKNIVSSAVTPTELAVLDGITATTAELNYTDGVTSAIQTQLDAKAPTASPTLTGTTTVDRLDYDRAVGGVSAIGNLGATETIDWSTHTHYTGTLDSNITFTYSNQVSGQSVTLYLSYDGSAARTITWPTTTWLDNATGAAPTAPAASGNVLVVTLVYIGTTTYGSATGNYAVYA